MQQVIKSSITAAVLCLPPELTNVIAAYATRRPYWFTAAGLAEKASCSVQSDGGTKLQVNGGQIGFAAWYRFVSEVTIGDGHLDWTIDLPNGHGGWIGVGLTTSTTNKQTEPDISFFKFADETDWIMSISSGLMYRKGTAFRSLPTGQTARSIRFTADPSTGVVRIRYKSTDLTPPADEPMYDRPPLLALLRPVVVLAGRSSVVFRSETDDDASDDRPPITFVSAVD